MMVLVGGCKEALWASFSLGLEVVSMSRGMSIWPVGYLRIAAQPTAFKLKFKIEKNGRSMSGFFATAFFLLATMTMHQLWPVKQ